MRKKQVESSRYLGKHPQIKPAFNTKYNFYCHLVLWQVLSELDGSPYEDEPAPGLPLGKEGEFQLDKQIDSMFQFTENSSFEADFK